MPFAAAVCIRLIASQALSSYMLRKLLKKLNEVQMSSVWLTKELALSCLIPWPLPDT